MIDVASRVLRVALIADRAAQGESLKGMLEAGGLVVAMDQSIRDYDPDQVSDEDIDVLLVNLDEDTSYEMERLEALIERSSVPILFNEGGIPGGSGWGRKLIAKLSSLAQSRLRPLETGVVQPATAAQAPSDIAVDAATVRSTERPALRVVGAETAAADTAEQVWVLGSSLGGPQALKAFLSDLAVDLPIAYVIAQHIGKPFVPLLAEQLARVTGLRVMPAVAGRRICSREVILVPIGVRFALTDDGTVELRDEPTRGPYKPCIDEVMEEVARCYGDRSSAIVFSGMGEDGALGAVAINAAGGRVWAQEAESCVISSMPDAARRCGVVEFSGTPSELAQHMAERFTAHAVTG